MSITITKLAEELGVAPSTVSNALNGRMKGAYPKSLAKADKIRSYAIERGYRPNAAARAVRSQRTYQIGVLLPNRPGHATTHPHAFESVLGVNSGLQDTGYIVSIIRFDDLTQDVASHTRLFSEEGLDGLVVIGHYPDWAVPKLESLVSKIVWLDTDVWRETGCVRRDEAAAGRETVERAGSLGYGKMIWLGYPDSPEFRHYSHEARRSAAFAAAGQLGLDIELREFISYEWEADPKRLTHGLSPDTLVVAESAYHAQVLSHQAMSRGVSAPRDFGLACCDGARQFERLWPDLSRIDFDRFGMGSRAAAMLRHMIDHPKTPVASELVHGQWIQGATVKTPGTQSQTGNSAQGHD